jgi:hypothetical protein
MEFYNEQHKHYCGIDLHARFMYVCIINQAGEILFHKNYSAQINSPYFAQINSPVNLLEIKQLKINYVYESVNVDRSVYK